MAQRGRPFRLNAEALVRAQAVGLLAFDERKLGGLMALQTSAPRPALAPQPGIGLVSIDGPLQQRAEDHWCGFIDGYDAVAARFAAEAASADVGAIVLRVDSFGGVVPGIEESIKRMVAARDASGKKVFAYVDEAAFSAAYWLIAALADGGVYLPESGCVGSIGVYAVMIDESKALEQAGLDVTLVRNPDGKAENHSADPVSDLRLDRTRASVAETAGRFFRAVASARGMTPEAVRALNGACFTGHAAVSAGLVNGVASFEDVLTMAAAAAS